MKYTEHQQYMIDNFKSIGILNNLRVAVPVDEENTEEFILPNLEYFTYNNPGLNFKHRYSAISLDFGVYGWGNSEWDSRESLQESILWVLNNTILECHLDKYGEERLQAIIEDHLIDNRMSEHPDVYRLFKFRKGITTLSDIYDSLPTYPP